MINISGAKQTPMMQQFNKIKERYGDVANVEMDCGECLIKYETDMKTACPEWDKDCRIKE